MSDLFWLTDAQMARLEPYFSKSHGKHRVATRYDRCPKAFFSAIALAAIVIYWL